MDKCSSGPFKSGQTPLRKVWTSEMGRPMGIWRVTPRRQSQKTTCIRTQTLRRGQTPQQLPWTSPKDISPPPRQAPPARMWKSKNAFPPLQQSSPTFSFNFHFVYFFSLLLFADKNQKPFNYVTSHKITKTTPWPITGQQSTCPRTSEALVSSFIERTMLY